MLGAFGKDTCDRKMGSHGLLLAYNRAALGLFDL